MENRNIIIILLVIIVILAAGLGVMVLNHSNAKEATKIKITSDKSQYEEDEQISILLTDLNKTPLSKEVVNITITNSKGKAVVDDVVKTDSKGKAKLDFDIRKGKYTVKALYGGNDNYSECNASQKLTIKETEKQSTSSVDMSLYTQYSPTVGYCRIIETYEENALLETPDGNYYVMAGDGIYTYGGRDSQGHIQLGSPLS